MQRFGAMFHDRKFDTALRLSAMLVLGIVLPTQLMTAPLPTGVGIENMTWADVRSAVQSGYTTVIIPTGGLEQNGPHMIIGKHDYLVSEAAARIAKSVGRTLVAPVVAYVPEGDYVPPTGHMRFAGTMGVTEAAFEGVLDGIARSLKAGGFKTICFIGDHGQSQAGQAVVAQRLSAEWAKDGVRVVQVDAYYDDKAQIKLLLSQGRSLEEIGQHASIIDTSELMSVDPSGVDLSRFRSMTFSLEPNGSSGDPRSANSKLGAILLDMRIAAAASQIKSMLATQ
jgi:creatinine amidohydrolase